MHDGLELETRGLPTAVICTEPFRATADAIRVSRGVPDYPFVIVEHPIGSIDEEELERRAAIAADEALRILTSQ